MKVLLLGVYGNVGSRLLPALRKHNHQVIGYVRTPAKLSPEATANLDAIVVGSATDSDAIKNAIFTHNCDAVVNAAGVAGMTRWHSQGDFPAIFAAVVKATVEASQERGVPIRCWLMSGFAILDSPKKPYLLMDYLPVFPAHRANYQLVKSQPVEALAWSLFCGMEMPPKYNTPQYPPAADTSASNLVANTDAPPDWGQAYRRIPLIGNYLNAMTEIMKYMAVLENCVDFVAADLEKGLDSELVGKRVGVKERTKAE